MEELIRILTESGLEDFIEKGKEPLLLKDEVYLKDKADLRELEERYLKLDLTQEQRRLINDYIACGETAYARAADLCYMAGIRDAVLLLKEMGLLKE